MTLSLACPVRALPARRGRGAGCCRRLICSRDDRPGQPKLGVSRTTIRNRNTLRYASYASTKERDNHTVGQQRLASNAHKPSSVQVSKIGTATTATAKASTEQSKRSPKDMAVSRHFFRQMLSQSVHVSPRCRCRGSMTTQERASASLQKHHASTAPDIFNMPPFRLPSKLDT